MIRSRHPCVNTYGQATFGPQRSPPVHTAHGKVSLWTPQEENARPPRPTPRARSYPVYAAAHAPPSATASHRAPPAHKERSGAGGWKVGAGP